jgi:ElaA protein
MAGDIKIDIKPFDELTLKELHACLKLRGEVFVVGQQIYQVPDVDEHDSDAHHVMMWLGKQLVGTARLLEMGGDQYIKVGRVAVAEAHRGKGLGSSMMRAIHTWIGQVPGRRGVMSAQAHLQRWYGHLGWIQDSDLYMEAGIKHVELHLPPENTA